MDSSMISTESTQHLSHAPETLTEVCPQPRTITPSLAFDRHDLDAAYVEARRTPDYRWHKAIEKAYDQLRGNRWSFDGKVVVLHSATSTERYAVSIEEPMVCTCRAHANGLPCWHIAAARLCVRAAEHKGLMLTLAPIFNRARPATVQAAVEELY